MKYPTIILMIIVDNYTYRMIKIISDLQGLFRKEENLKAHPRPTGGAPVSLSLILE